MILLGSFFYRKKKVLEIYGEEYSSIMDGIGNIKKEGIGFSYVTKNKVMIKKFNEKLGKGFDFCSVDKLTKKKIKVKYLPLEEVKEEILRLIKLGMKVNEKGMDEYLSILTGRAI